jgi:hypothetical protein
MQSNAPSHKQILYGLTNWGLFISGAVNLAVGTWAAAHQNFPFATTSLTAGLVLLFASTIDRFESLKGLGIEAKTRQLDRKIEEVDEALHRLKELAEITGGALMDLNSKMGRWDSAPSPGESYALAQKVRSLMTALGSEPTVIARTLRPWARMMCLDLAVALVTPVRQAIATEISKLNRQRSEIRQPLDPRDPEFLRLTAEINALNACVGNQLNKMHEWELDEYPDRLMSIFDQVPLLDQQTVASLRDNALRSAPAMHSLRDTYTIPDVSGWSQVIDEARMHPRT